MGASPPACRSRRSRTIRTTSTCRPISWHRASISPSRCKGNSMIEAGILDGDTVLIRRTETADNGDIVVALVDDEEATLKRMRRKGNSVALEAANPAYETRIFGPRPRAGAGNAGRPDPQILKLFTGSASGLRIDARGKPAPPAQGLLPCSSLAVPHASDLLLNRRMCAPLRQTSNRSIRNLADRQAPRRGTAAMTTSALPHRFSAAPSTCRCG